MLKLYDLLFTLLHLIIIGFNLLGWIWPKTRKLHFIAIVITLSCWLILGIWYGIGFCPVTEWQWQIKARMGETDLPASFIKYFLDKLTGLSIDANLIDFITVAGFALAIVMALTKIKSWRHQKKI